MNRANYSSRVDFKLFDSGQEESSVLLFQIFLFSAGALLLCYALHARFHAILSMLRKIQGEPTKNVRNWNAAFRCLARTHPTSTELQTMSHEQMRQDVIGRYKAKGNTHSSSLNSTNGFSRDRRAVMAKTSRHRTGKEGNANERNRPFSDALFHDTSVVDGSTFRIHFPVGLGWRTAYSRGIIKDNSLQSTSFNSRSKALLDKRAELALENEDNDWSEVSNQNTRKVEKVPTIKANARRDSAFSFSDSDNLNGTKGIENESESAGTKRGVSMEAEVSKPSNEKGHHTNGEQWKKKGKSNQPSRVVVPVSEEIFETAVPTERKDRSSKQGGKVEKQNSYTQPSKNTHTSEVTRRTQKSKNNPSKSNETGTSNKVARSTKNAHTAPSQKQKAAPRITSSGSLLKGSPPNAWQADRQKADTKTAAKDESNKSQKKLKDKEKSKKKTPKHTAQGKNSISNSVKERDRDSEPSRETGANAKQSKLQVVSPPPGFGAPATNTPVSPSAKIKLHSTSTTESQLSLDTMLQGDLSLGAPSHPSSAQLPFRNANADGNDLLFSGSMHESNPSPTKHAFNVVENPNTLPSPVEQPWLPTLLNEEPELVEQPWLPALRNEDAESGFDVMDFLDGILQDGSSTEPEPMLEREPSPPGLAVGTQGNSSTPVSANPWARESRAAAYGISFDDEERSTKTPTADLEDILLQGSPMEKVLPTVLGGNLPLLTPAAILSAEGNEIADVEEDDKAMSFYAGLIDE